MDKFLEEKDFCPLCRKPVETSYEEHVATDSHRYNVIVHYNEKNRKELAQDKLGVTLKVDNLNGRLGILRYNAELGKYFLDVPYSEASRFRRTFEFKCIFENTSNELVKVTQGKILEGTGMMIDMEENWVQNEIAVTLRPNCKYSNILIEFDLKDMVCGKYCIPFGFNLKKEGEEDAMIFRTIVISIYGSSSPSQELETRRVLTPKISPKWIITRLHKPTVNRSSDEDYPIDEEVVEYIIRGFKPRPGAEFEREPQHLKEARRVMIRGLAMPTYRKYFHYLLWLEEKISSIEVGSMFLQGVPARVTYQNYLVFYTYSQSNRLFPGAPINIRCQGSKQAFQGYVRNVYTGTVIVDELNERFFDEFYTIRRPLIDVQFQLCRLPLKRKHLAVEAVFYKGHHRKLFPDNYPDDYHYTNTPEPRWFLQGPDFINRDVADSIEQSTAVNNILNSTSRGVPFIVVGPPGTGKTVTIVEAICQILKRTDKRILVCAPANAHCDMLAIKLMKYCKPKELCRIYSRGMTTPKVPQELVKYSNTNAKRSISGMKSRYLKKYRIVISTLVFMGNFDETVYRPDYIFIDEASQAVEPEVCVALSFLNHGGDIILAGDPKQLKPLVKSSLAQKYGLDISYMQRLLETQKKYKNLDPNFVVTLTKNYRNHPTILQISNQMFYNNSVTTAVTYSVDPISTVNVFPQIENGNAEVTGHPLEFCAVSSQESRDVHSTSLFNADETLMLIKYIQTLLKLSIIPPVTTKDIGIISPYSSQVRRIRTALLNQGLPDIETGTVETFQGREKRVILMSTVRGQYDLLKYDNVYGLGFLKEPQRFNVAITRAVSKLVIIGCPLVLNSDNKWGTFIDTCLRLKTYYGMKPQSRDENKETECLEKFESFPTLLKELQKPCDIPVRKTKVIWDFYGNAITENGESENEHSAEESHDEGDLEEYDVLSDAITENGESENEHSAEESYDEGDLEEYDVLSDAITENGESENEGQENEHSAEESSTTETEIDSSEESYDEGDEEESYEEEWLSSEGLSEEEIEVSENCSSEEYSEESDESEDSEEPSVEGESSQDTTSEESTIEDNLAEAPWTVEENTAESTAPEGSEGEASSNPSSEFEMIHLQDGQTTREEEPSTDDSTGESIVVVDPTEELNQAEQSPDGETTSSSSEFELIDVEKLDDDSIEVQHLPQNTHMDAAEITGDLNSLEQRFSSLQVTDAGNESENSADQKGPTETAKNDLDKLLDFVKVSKKDLDTQPASSSAQDPVLESESDDENSPLDFVEVRMEDVNTKDSNSADLLIFESESEDSSNYLDAESNSEVQDALRKASLFFDTSSSSDSE